jgi:YbbR domain-containing protein
LIHFLTRNLLWKLFALVVAFGIWLNVASEPELETIVSIPVEYNNVPKDLEISSTIVESIEVEARGPAGQLRALSDSGVAEIVDFSSVKGPGERTFTLTAAQLKLPRGILVIRTIPAQLRFQFEKRVTRAVPVKVEFSGKPQAGVSVAQVDVQPPDFNITGPESHVMNAKAQVLADPFDLTDVSGDTVRKLAVYAAEPEVRILGIPQVTVKIRVRHGR